jgi:methionine biosynthesis protein MetW
VLDLGCGEGDLLGRLKARGHRMVMGVELRELAILECLRGGLDVIQADLERGLLGFAAGQFDFVVLSRTLQVIHDVERVIDEVLRIGRQAFVSFPNFGHHRVRQMLCKEGHAPRTPQLHHAWYDSPNIRFFTIADFEEFCRERKILVHRRLMLDTESGKPVDDEPNLNADLALFVISRS